VHERDAGAVPMPVPADGQRADTRAGVLPTWARLTSKCRELARRGSDRDRDRTGAQAGKARSRDQPGIGYGLPGGGEKRRNAAVVIGEDDVTSISRSSLALDQHAVRWPAAGPGRNRLLGLPQEYGVLAEGRCSIPVGVE